MSIVFIYFVYYVYFISRILVTLHKSHLIYCYDNKRDGTLIQKSLDAIRLTTLYIRPFFNPLIHDFGIVCFFLTKKYVIIPVAENTHTVKRNSWQKFKGASVTCKFYPLSCFILQKIHINHLHCRCFLKKKFLMA